MDWTSNPAEGGGNTPGPRARRRWVAEEVLKGRCRTARRSAVRRSYFRDTPHGAPRHVISQCNSESIFYCRSSPKRQLRFQGLGEYIDVSMYPRSRRGYPRSSRGILSWAGGNLSSRVAAVSLSFRKSTTRRNTDTGVGILPDMKASRSFADTCRARPRAVTPPARSHARFNVAC